MNGRLMFRSFGNLDCVFSYTLSVILLNQFLL